MRPLHVLSLAVLTVFAALALSACDSGTPDPGESRIDGQWQLVYGSGMVYRYALTDVDGAISGTVDFVYVGSSIGTAAVTGTRTGAYVELDHAASNPAVTIHYVLAFDAEAEQMTGYGDLSTGIREENVLITRPLM